MLCISGHAKESLEDQPETRSRQATASAASGKDGLLGICVNRGWIVPVKQHERGFERAKPLCKPRREEGGGGDSWGAQKENWRLQKLISHSAPGRSHSEAALFLRLFFWSEDTSGAWRQSWHEQSTENVSWLFHLLLSKS